MLFQRNTCKQTARPYIHCRDLHRVSFSHFLLKHCARPPHLAGGGASFSIKRDVQLQPHGNVNRLRQLHISVGVCHSTRDFPAWQRCSPQTCRLDSSGPKVERRESLHKAGDLWLVLPDRANDSHLVSCCWSSSVEAAWRPPIG